MLLIILPDGLIEGHYMAQNFWSTDIHYCLTTLKDQGQLTTGAPTNIVPAPWLKCSEPYPTSDRSSGLVCYQSIFEHPRH